MSSPVEPYKVLLQRDAYWRESNMMKLPNTNLTEQLGTRKLGARANTWHRHVEQDELYFVLEGTGRIRAGGDTLTIPRYGAVLVRPSHLRQVFNGTAEGVLWLICGAPPGRRSGRSRRYLSRGSAAFAARVAWSQMAAGLSP